MSAEPVSTGAHIRQRTSRQLRCKRCNARAQVQLRQHNSAFCRDCFLIFFQRQVERAIEKESMLRESDKVLIAVSGGKDSLALWDALVGLGYSTTGLHLALGIGSYSTHSTDVTKQFAEARGLPLIIVTLAEEGMAVPDVAQATRRPACSACGTMKRHYFDKVAVEQGFSVVATGHNLDDEAARLLGNVLRWQTEYLARQSPVLDARHEKFVRKIKPLFRTSEFETAAYAFYRGIEYVVEECPNSLGAPQLLYKDVLNRLEVASPGTKLHFLQEFLARGRAAITAESEAPPSTCEQCGMPSFGRRCSFCRLRGSSSSQPVSVELPGDRAYDSGSVLQQRSDAAPPVLASEVNHE